MEDKTTECEGKYTRAQTSAEVGAGRFPSIAATLEKEAGWLLEASAWAENT